MTLGSRARDAWHVTRDALARLNRLLADTGNSDDDLVFHIRRSGDDRRSREIANDPRSRHESRPSDVGESDFNSPGV